MRFGVKHALQQFLELLFGDGILHFDNLLPDVTLFENFYRKVIQIDFQNPDTGLLKAINQLTLEPLHFDGLFRLVGADKERDLVAESLLIEKALARDHCKEMLKSVLYRHSGYICCHRFIPFTSDSNTGKCKISLRLP